MTMADSRYSLDRVSFIVLNQDQSQHSRFDFSINPQSIQEQTQNRSVYLNTLDWGSVQNYGMGQKTISISGTTGWRRGLGIDEAKALKSFLEDYQRQFPVDSSNNRVTLIFANYTDDYSYRVDLAPEGYQFSQDVSQPLMYRYTINLIVLGNSNTASPQDRNSTVIGKPGEGGYSDGGSGRSNLMKGATAQAIANLKSHAR